jgi:hypothetical protein
MKFNRIERGWQASEDGKYAVIADGYEASKYCGAEGDYEGFAGGEWAAVYDPQGRLRTADDAGDNLDWFSTAREAKEACRQHKARLDSVR